MMKKKKLAKVQKELHTTDSNAYTTHACTVTQISQIKPKKAKTKNQIKP